MRQTLVTALAVAALALGAARETRAQAIGIPVYNPGVPTGLGLYADLGLPNDDAGDGTAFALTGRLGLGMLGATATVATFNPQGDGDNITSFGATGNLKVFGGPLVPLAITLQAGAGYAKFNGLVDDVKQWRFPVGVGIALTVPNPALAIKPWIAPRIDVLRTDPGSAGDTETDVHFAVSGGVELNFLNGFGVHAAYDWRKQGDLRPSTLGLGAHYAIRVPGL